MIHVIYFFIYLLALTDDVTESDYVASNERMITE
jgi:hypothetical protein